MNMRHFLKLITFVTLALTASAASAQKFSHASHYTKHNNGKISDCSDCHKYTPATADFGRPAHDACQSCHATEDFTAQTAGAALCKTCHTGDGAALGGYPNVPPGKFIALEKFSHQGHLDTAGKVFAKFGKVSCDNCHDINQKDGKAGIPSHSACNQCHGDKAGKDATAPLLTSRAKQKDCLGCHGDATKDITTREAKKDSWQEGAASASPYVDDLIFSHPQHLSHNNAKQACKDCHVGVENSVDSSRLHLPTMGNCDNSCHGDAAKVTESKTTDKCAVCHKVIKAGEKPQPPKHYGPREDHHATIIMQKGPLPTRDNQDPFKGNLTCGWCHETKASSPPKPPGPKKGAVQNPLCVNCHMAEGVPDETLEWNILVDREVGQLKTNGGIFTTFSTAFEFKQLTNVAAPLNDIDTQDADVYANLGFDSKGYGKSRNLSASLFGSFQLDAGETPAFSPFADQFGIDELPRDERGRFGFSGEEGDFAIEDFDRVQSNALLLYRAYVEITDQPIGGNAKATLRAGRQSLYNTAEPWLFIDGINAKIDATPNFGIELFGGNRASPFTKENDLANEIRPVAGANVFLAIPMPAPTGELMLQVQDVFHLANATRLALEWDTFPHLDTYADFKLINFAPDKAQLGFLFFNPDWGSQMAFHFRHQFDNAFYDYDYSSLSTRGGADLLLSDPNLANALAQDDAAKAAFDELSAERAEAAAKRVGKQLSDFENFNMLPEAPNNFISLLFSQKMAKKLFLNLSIDARQVNADKRNNTSLVIDGQGADIAVGNLNSAEVAVVSDLIAEDNRYAYTYPFVELGPGVDLYDLGVKGLHLSASAKYRLADPGNKLKARLSGGADAAENQVTFFGDISGEKDSTGLTLLVEANQVLLQGKLRLGASMGIHRYDYLGRYVVVDEDGVALTAFSEPGATQKPGLLNLNGIFGMGWLRLKVTDKIFARALYSAETDLQFFPDDPFVASGQVNFAGGNENFASSDVELLQRFMIVAGFHY